MTTQRVVKEMAEAVYIADPSHRVIKEMAEAIFVGNPNQRLVALKCEAIISITESPPPRRRSVYTVSLV
jgi:hypothetical protein